MPQETQHYLICIGGEQHCLVEEMKEALEMAEMLSIEKSPQVITVSLLLTVFTFDKQSCVLSASVHTNEKTNYYQHQVSNDKT